MRHEARRIAGLQAGGKLNPPLELLPTSDDVTALAEDFRLLRVPLAKQEIASQGQLKEPLKFQKFPPKGDQSDAYEYDKSDPKRSHIMPTGISARGSVTWQALDIKKGQERWIERRDLSDRIVALWGKPATASSQQPSAA